MTRKVAVQCVRSKLAWQKVFRHLISLQKKTKCSVCSQTGWLISPCWFRFSSRFPFWILELGFPLLWSHYLFIGHNKYFIFSFTMRIDIPSKKRCHFTPVVLYLSTMTFFSVFKLAAGMSFCCPLFIITWQSVQPFARVRIFRFQAVKVNGKLLG